MNDNTSDDACGEPCRMCGDRIGADEGREIRWDEIDAEEGSRAEWAEQTGAYVHTNCA